MMETNPASGQISPVHLMRILVPATGDTNFVPALQMSAFITGGGVATGKTPVWLHLTLVIAALVMYARAYWIEINAMMQNAKLMEEYLRE